MDNSTSSTGGMKRPAEPVCGPAIQPHHQPKAPNLKPITLRMSNIPIGITKVNLSRILEGLELIRTTGIEEFPQTGAKQRRRTNIHSLSLAPAASSFDSDQFQVATITFKEIPPELAHCVSETGPGIVTLEAEGEDIEVDVDTHFQGLTPLNHASSPSVEYVVTRLLETII